MVLGEIIGVSKNPVKTNSSFGNWFVTKKVYVPNKEGFTLMSEFFFRKKEAIKFIENNIIDEDL
ncbi:MAG: hypothetical protein PHC28_09520 [Flavobacterium sp.]|uniref:hypothetical protein n=1 Tax=Flavobacterium sp. TaxID=239 RepID=UPI002638B249|nr:hypothetical protein [Flavobacterium sp.]MDD5150695.1 hypothetical protein [Flavobacterium sp.]